MYVWALADEGDLRDVEVGTGGGPVVGIRGSSSGKVGGPRGGPPGFRPGSPRPHLAAPLKTTAKAPCPIRSLRENSELAHGLRPPRPGSKARTGVQAGAQATAQTGAVGQGNPIGQPGMRTRFDSNPVSTRVQTLASDLTRPGGETKEPLPPGPEPETLAQAH